MTSDSLNGFDIKELMDDKSIFGGIGKGKNTVTVDKNVYPSEEVNYYLYGILASLADGAYVLEDMPDMVPPGSYHGPNWYSHAATLVNYRITIGWIVGASYTMEGQGDYRGIGFNVEGRLAWFNAGYSGDFRMAENTALTGVLPGAPYHGEMTWAAGKQKEYLFGNLIFPK
jgi:hypothetical protein